MDGKLIYINNITFQNLRSLEILKLHDNKLVNFNFLLFNLYNSHLTELSLHDNVWSCDCAHIQDLANYIGGNYHKIEDVNSINCYYNNSSNKFHHILPTCSVTKLQVVRVGKVKMAIKALVINTNSQLVLKHSQNKRGNNSWLLTMYRLSRSRQND